MILVKNLFLKYVREYYALYDISFEIKDGERVAFAGAAESGKTSLLRILAKLESFTSGEVYIRDISLKKINYNTDINVGYLPESPAFFENKSVYANFAWLLKKQKVKKNEIESKINDTLINFNLQNLKDVLVHNLSLYEKYVLSIARLTLRKLDIVLIDDILFALNDEEKESLIDIMAKTFNDKDLTLILASENKEAIKKLCERTINFKSGSIIEDKKYDK